MTADLCTPTPNSAPSSYVEDNDAIAYLFQKALEEAGVRLRLIRATDGAHAVAVLLREGSYRDAPTPNLIILDIHLPKKNGFEVLTSLRQIETLENVPKFMFSSSTDPADRARALALGAHKFFSNDGGWDSLLETAKEVCSLLAHDAKEAA